MYIYIYNLYLYRPKTPSVGFLPIRFDLHLNYIYIYTYTHYCAGRHPAPRPYMLNTLNEENNTVFYSYLACIVNPPP